MSISLSEDISNPNPNPDTGKSYLTFSPRSKLVISVFSIGLWITFIVAVAQGLPYCKNCPSVIAVVWISLVFVTFAGLLPLLWITRKSFSQVENIGRFTDLNQDDEIQNDGTGSDRVELKSTSFSNSSSDTSDETVDSTPSPEKNKRFQKIKTVSFYCFIFLFCLVSMFLMALHYDWQATTAIQTNGSMKIKGLSAPVKIYQEDDGMLHIYAENLNDLARAQGYAVAQRRLWQIHFTRMLTRAELSKYLGIATLDIDRVLRQYGFYHYATKTWETGVITQKHKDLLISFCDGVNQYINSDPPLPIEMQILSITPEPISPVDVIVWSKLMSFDLSKNIHQEKSRFKLFEEQKLTMSEIDLLFPQYPKDTVLGPTIIKAVDWNVSSISKGNFQKFSESDPESESESPAGTPFLKKNKYSSNTYKKSTEKDSPKISNIPRPKPSPLISFLKLDSLMDSIFDTNKEHSNNWVIGPSHTTHGETILANDPHLGYSSPMIWYLVHLESPEYEGIGSAFPIAPGVVLGRNKDIAWGATNTGTDVTDLFILDEISENNYSWNSTTTPYITRKEKIIVSTATGDFDPKNLEPFETWDSKTSTITRTIRTSVYGPVWSDLPPHLSGLPDPEKGATDHVVAFRWVTLEDIDYSLFAFLDLGFAKNFTEFRNSLQNSGFRAPPQNFIYADEVGNIGYVVPGLIPLRPWGDWQYYANQNWTYVTANHPAYQTNNPYILANGMYPTIGNGSFDWLGFVPADKMPFVFNPADDFIVTANNKVLAYDIIMYNNASISNDRDITSSRRARRIIELIQEHSGSITSETVRKIQTDVTTLGFKDIKPVFSSLDLFDTKLKNEAWKYHAGDNTPEENQKELDNYGSTPDGASWSTTQRENANIWTQRLSKWNGNASCLSEEASVWAAWFIEARRMTSPMTDDTLWQRRDFIINTILDAAVDDDSNSICKLHGHSSCLQFASEALLRAIARLSKPTILPWCQVRQAELIHPILGESPLGCLFNRHTDHAGDDFTVNVGSTKFDLQNDHGPSYRSIFTLNRPGSQDSISKLIIPMGNSGNVVNPQYDNWNQLWSSGASIEVLDGKNATNKLTLSS